MTETAEFWVSISFLIFFLCAGFVGGFKYLVQGLDNRALRVARELQSAKKIREEAETELEKSRKRHKEALKEAESIIELAHEEAKIILAEAEEKAENFSALREKQLKTRILQAEAQSLLKIREKAADAAIKKVEMKLTRTGVDERVMFFDAAMETLQKNFT